jgi:thioredoxin-related protein
MTSFFFSRSSLSKNNNNDDDSKETLSSPSALRYAKKKNNTALLVMKARTRIFCTIISQQKIRKDKKRKNVLFTLLSILTVYSTQYLRKKRHQKHLLSSERHATRPQQLRHKTFRGANRSSRVLEVTCACTNSAFFQQQKRNVF